MNRASAAVPLCGYVTVTPDATLAKEQAWHAGIMSAGAWRDETGDRRGWAGDRRAIWWRAPCHRPAHAG